MNQPFQRPTRQDAEAAHTTAAGDATATGADNGTAGPATADRPRARPFEPGASPCDDNTSPLVPSATLEQLEGWRADALAMAADLHRRLRAFYSRAQLATGATMLRRPGHEEGAGPSFNRDWLHALDATEAPWQPNGERLSAEAHFLEETRRRIDSAMWGRIMTFVDIDAIMDHTAREDLRRQLVDNPPPATADNVRATLRQLQSEKHEIFLRGLAVAFSKLDRRFRSHLGFRIGSRIIYRLSHDDYIDYRASELIDDVERALAIVAGDTVPRGQGITRLISDAWRRRPCEVENRWLKVRLFGNGNAHLWFKDRLLLANVNRLLAEYYGETLADDSEEAGVGDHGPGYLTTPAHNFGLFETPTPVADALFDRLGVIAPGCRVLEPSAGRGRLALRARDAGAAVTCVEIQSELADTLRRHGLHTVHADFLKLTPADLGTYDVIIANPPFDARRDVDHVRHMTQFLRPGGRLVAVMGAAAEVSESQRAASLRAWLDRHAAPLGHWRSFFTDLPERSFASEGTNINTVLLACRLR